MNEPTIQPDNDLVICPNCVTQFRAIPVNVQKEYFDMQDRLKSLDAQPVPDTVAVPRDQLEHWAEYWNGNANEKSMTDALEHILGEVDDLLRAAQEAK